MKVREKARERPAVTLRFWKGSLTVECACIPLRDDQVTACIRMEPQDNGMLPMQYWRLASNSFLLHGYYSYRHFDYGTKNDGTYIFGIPESTMSGERFMAGMF